MLFPFRICGKRRFAFETRDERRKDSDVRVKVEGSFVTPRKIEVGFHISEKTKWGKDSEVVSISLCVHHQKKKTELRMLRYRCLCDVC